MKRTRQNRFKKSKFIKQVNGAISILLCLLLTPFLSTALVLVEYARYQQVFELADEIYELTGISILSDYDSYIHGRFGLLAASQDGDLDEGINDLFQQNLLLLGKQITAEDIRVNGTFPLSDAEVLRQQILDMSELNALSAVMMEDFKLEDLLDELENISLFQRSMDTVSGLAETAEALTEAVQAATDLVTNLQKLQTLFNDAIDNCKKLVDTTGRLYTNLATSGIYLPQEISLEELEAAATIFNDLYVDDFIYLCETANNLKNNVDKAKTTLDLVIGNIDTFQNAVSNVKSSAGGLFSGGGGDGDSDGGDESSDSDDIGESGGVAATVLDTIMDTMVELSETALTEFAEESLVTIEDTLNGLVEDILDQTGLGNAIDIFGRYNEIVSGEYFSLPLSSRAESDLRDLLSCAQSAYASQNGGDLVSFFQNKLVPDVSIDFDSLLEPLTGALDSASEALFNSAEEKLSSLLSSLVAVVKDLFHLELFFDPALNSYVSGSNTSDSPYQAFLDALTSMMNEADALSTSIKGLDLLKGIKAMAGMFRAIADLMGAIWKIAGGTISGLAELGGDVLTLDGRGLYEKLIISGYMSHNLPCRTDVASTSSSGDNFQQAVDLDGSGLTGFDYNDIVRPSTGVQNTIPVVGEFASLAQTLDDMAHGGGDDPMFKGAELEYIRAGTDSEIANQIIVFFDLYFLRLVLDLPSVFLDPEVAATAAAATIAAWVVYILYIVAEPFCDTVLLVNGESVPLIRTNCWLTPTGVPNFIKTLGDAVLGDALQDSLQEFTDSLGDVDGMDEAGDSKKADLEAEEKAEEKSEDEAEDKSENETEKDSDGDSDDDSNSKKDDDSDSDSDNDSNSKKDDDSDSDSDDGSNSKKDGDSDSDSDDDSDGSSGSKKDKVLGKLSDLSSADYQTHLLILLLAFVHTDTQIKRLMDLIELETTAYYAENDSEFSMSKTYTTFELSAPASFNPFFDMGIFSDGTSFIPSLDITQTLSY